MLFNTVQPQVDTLFQIKLSFFLVLYKLIYFYKIVTIFVVDTFLVLLQSQF